MFDEQREEYLKLREDINNKLEDPKNLEWQQIINSEYNKCRMRYRTTLSILEGLDFQKLGVNTAEVIEHCLADLFEAFGDMDPVTTRRMTEFFNEPTKALLLDRYIYCMTTNHGYAILDSEYKYLNLPSPVVYCTNDLYQNTKNINNTGWFNELIKQSNVAYNYLQRHNNVTQLQKEKKSN